jgi:S-adenosylmethionine:tRNA ribosyltransferase-isomerase
MDVEIFDYELPQKFIAQKPHIPRDECKLLACNRKNNTIEHKIFKDIVEYIKPKDLLILNDTKVIPARLFAKKQTGGKIEIFLLEEIEQNSYLCLTKGKIKDKIKVSLKNGIQAEIFKTNQDKRIVHFLLDKDIRQFLDEIGEVPLPPYINRDYTNYDKNSDFKYYQTVYAKKEGAVAAPTAGLHFSENLINKIKNRGVNIAYITLHVGIGTFRPVKEKVVEAHKMHKEMYEINRETANLFNKTKKEKGRVIAVGTTVIRTLESAVDNNGNLSEKKGATDIFIYPGYKYKAIDAMITNFHLPKSTLLMLVSAFYEREKVINCYKKAIENNYRFFSFGDAMFIY